MPQSSSARKTARQNEERRIRNKSVRSSVRSSIKGFREAVGAGNLEEARAQLNATQKRLDQAVAKGVFHKNTAGRYKSHMATLLNTLAEQSG